MVNTPAGGLRLVNWHLGLGDAERQWQVRHALQHAGFRDCDGPPTLLAGDFNDWRNRLQGTLREQFRLQQVTTPPSRFRSFPAWLAIGSLDKAFVCDRIKVERAHVVTSRLARVASDHLPLVVDFELL